MGFAADGRRGGAADGVEPTPDPSLSTVGDHLPTRSRGEGSLQGLAALGGAAFGLFGAGERLELAALAVDQKHAEAVEA